MKRDFVEKRPSYTLFNMTAYRFSKEMTG